MRYLPICLNLEAKAVVIVGGGAVGTQKVRDFAECGARIKVVSPEVSAYIQAEADAGRIELVRRGYREGDIVGAFLVMVATDDPETNAAIFAEATRAGQMVNVCDDPPHCNFIFASKIERGPLTVSIFTHATSPAFSKRVRRELERVLGPEYARMAELLAEVRPRVKEMPGLTQPERQAIFERIVYSDILYLFAEGDTDGARERVERILAEADRGIPTTKTPRRHEAHEG
jgi:precorrin-2 dehydrogenase/sirohydrochlorin ferrochelatase